MQKLLKIGGKAAVFCVFVIFGATPALLADDGKRADTAQGTARVAPRQEKKPTIFQRGVEAEVAFYGRITSRPNPNHKGVFIYDLLRFGQEKPRGLPRSPKLWPAGVALKAFVGVPVKVTVIAKPTVTGPIDRKTPVLRLLSIERLEAEEAEALEKQAEKERLIDRSRTFNPSPNALAYVGAWGVRMPLPSSKWPDRLKAFDVSVFAKQIAQLKTASYVILNITQPTWSSYYTGPHPELEKVLKTASFRPDIGSAFPARDLIGEALDAIRATGKKTLVYFAPGGFARNTPEKELTEAWLSYIESRGMTNPEAVRKLILTHYAQQYGAKIDGWWFDGGGGATRDERLLWRKTVYDANPKAIIVYNRMSGPPFKSTAQCDYFGGHPTPRKRKKFWDPVNLPMIEAIEASPWMDPDGRPVDKPGMGALGHIFMGLQDRWTIGKCAFPPEQAMEWTNRVLRAGGMYTWAVPCSGSGIADKQFELLRKIDEEAIPRS